MSMTGAPSGVAPRHRRNYGTVAPSFLSGQLVDQFVVSRGQQNRVLAPYGAVRGQGLAADFENWRADFRVEALGIGWRGCPDGDALDDAGPPVRPVESCSWHLQHFDWFGDEPAGPGPARDQAFADELGHRGAYRAARRSVAVCQDTRGRELVTRPVLTALDGSTQFGRNCLNLWRTYRRAHPASLSQLALDRKLVAAPVRRAKRDPRSPSWFTFWVES